MSPEIEVEQEDDGRWIAESLIHPGVLCYGATVDEAVARVLYTIEVLEREEKSNVSK